MNLIILTNIYTIFTQIKIEGFEEAAQQNTLFAVLVSIILVLFSISLIFFKKYEDKNNELKTIQDNYNKELKTIQDNYNKELKTIQDNYINKLEVIRVEIMKREEELNRNWRESEKETLIVLKGVNSVLEMSDKMKENDTKYIINSIKSLESTIKQQNDK